MRIYSTNSIYKNNIINGSYSKPGQPNQIQQENNYPTVNYSQIPFCAMHNIKLNKMINIDLEKSKLLRQIEEILKTEQVARTPEETFYIKLRNSINHLRAKTMRLKKLNEQLEALETIPNMNRQQRLNALYEIKKEYTRIENSKPPKIQEPKPSSEKFDFKLISKFKNAILEDNFRLDKIYAKYYSGLENIKTISELQKKYPKIKIPKAPEEVISQKILSTLTRDFYENLHKQISISIDKGFNFVDHKVTDILKDISAKHKIDFDFLYLKIAEPLMLSIADKYNATKDKGFSTIQGKVKNNIPGLSEFDIKLLMINFDEFVLSTIRKQYLGSEKLNNITYTQGNITIPLKSLSNTEYKFEKVPEKPLSLIKLAEKIHLGQRNYELFPNEMLQSRLDYFATKELSNNEDLLKYLISFSEAATEDRPNLIKFLKELDNLNDGEKTISQTLESIEEKNIKPHETARINEEARLKVLQARKLEQQKTKALNNLKSDFDNAMDTLYLNDMTGIAEICSSYRPKDLKPQTLEDVNFIIKIINEHSNEFAEINKKQVESLITNWNNYKYYEANDSQNPIFIKAKQFATNSKGELDKNKVGQYITNAELVKTYPECLEFVPNPELVEKIMERNNSVEEQILLLCKLNNYSLLKAEEKASIVKLNELFNIKNPIEKVLLKHLMENEYANVDTITTLKLNETDTVESVICASAKQGIIKKYKFPNCIEYLTAFENALSKAATAHSSSGVKKIGKNNNSIEYKMELKVRGHDDRLFSSKGDYRFDVFSEEGIH